MEFTFSGDAAELRELFTGVSDSREDARPAKPKKRAIIDWVKTEIQEFRLMPNDLLPKTPELMTQFDASLPTVRGAIAALTAAGRVHFVPGHGVAVSS